MVQDSQNVPYHFLGDSEGCDLGGYGCWVVYMIVILVVLIWRRSSSTENKTFFLRFLSLNISLPSSVVCCVVGDNGLIMPGYFGGDGSGSCGI